MTLSAHAASNMAPPFHLPTPLFDRPIRFTPSLAIAMSVAVAAASSSSRYPLGHANTHHHCHPLRPVRFISSPPQPYASPSALLWWRSWQAKAPTPFCSAPSLGRVGWPRRDGNAWLLSFRAETDASSSAEEGDGDSSQVISALLPLVVVATAVAALGNPATFSWVSKELYAPALGGIMLSIGIQLSFDDFALAFKRPVPLSIGYMAQYMLKPLLGVLIAKVFKMPSAFFAGFMLTCCVSGAQLSSYASFLGKGDVALSILLTSYSTISSVIVTPILTGLLIGSVVPVNGIAMAKSILQVVLVPVTLGLLLNTYAKPVVNVIQSVMPFVAMVCTSLCIGSPLAINRSTLLSSQGFLLLLPIVTFHIAAFVGGYWVSKLPQLRQEEPVCRTISVCTGMQSSTLAGLLATQFLGISQAVPAACSVVVMAIFGLTLASYWGSGLRIRDVPLRLFPQASSGATS